MRGAEGGGKFHLWVYRLGVWIHMLLVSAVQNGRIKVNEIPPL